MKCPRCGADGRHVSVRLREQSATDLALEQQRRTRTCVRCEHAWDTIELSRGELTRLRGLSHLAVMGRVAR